MINTRLIKRVVLLVCLFYSLVSIGQVEVIADTISLGKGLWVSGLEGGVSNNRIGTGRGQLNDKGFKYIFNFNSGVFVKENLACGLSFRLSKTTRTYTHFYNNEERMYFGPWIRYYFKFQNNWYVYPELGISYGGFYSEYTSTIDNELLLTSGSGPGVNPGLGIVYFISKNAAFTIRWNYQANLFSGDTEVVSPSGKVTSSIKNVLSVNSSLLFGFQLYLHEFFF